MLLYLMLASKGMAGVPRASLAVIGGTLLTFFLIDKNNDFFAGVDDHVFLWIVAIDQFLDMGRSATNVIGNSIAAAAIAKWDDKLGDGSDIND
jgi:Na+/H+-dicarboxylate symporter